MNKTSIILGLSALAIAGAIVVPQAVLAYRGDPAMKGPNHTEAREQAIESANLAEFKKVCTTGRMCEVVDTQEELNTLKQMHEAVEKGDSAKAQELRTQLGLGMRNGSGHDMGMGYGRKNR